MIRPSTRETGAAYVSKTNMVAALIRELSITGRLRQRVRVDAAAASSLLTHRHIMGVEHPAWPLSQGAAAWPAWVTRKRGDEVTR